MSLNDTLRKFQQDMPHAKIRNIDVMDPVKQAAKQNDPAWNRKMADERKRSLDEAGHVSKVSHRDRIVAAIPSVDDLRWVPVCMKCCLAEELGGKARVLRPIEELRAIHFRDVGDLYYYTHSFTESGTVEFKRHTGMIGSPAHREKVMELTDEMYMDAIPCAEPYGEKLPCIRCKKPTANRKMRDVAPLDAKKTRGSKTRKAGAKMMEASGEVISESMVPPPERGCDHIAEQWRRDGRLQVRDMNGTPTEVAVFSSRKHMEQSMNEFNRNSPEVKLRNKWCGEKAKGSGSGRYD